MKRIFTLLIALLVVTSAVAQTTTSSISGRVLDENRKPVLGAAIVATHAATSTTYGTHSSESGIFHIDGMRSGGPYKIEISYVGYTTVRYDDVSLALGEERVFDIELKSSNDIDNIVVVANDLGGANSGGNHNFDTKSIDVVPTVSRSLYDVVQLAPQVSAMPEGGVSIGGASNRYNSFQIDGIPSNDMYGLTPTGTNGGLNDANPLPLDAIEEIRVSSSPYDVRESGFTGGSINVTTKSGTNTFAGSAYAYYNNNKFYGKGPNNTPLAKQSTQTYGASLGGAIVRDKLFFFVNGEFGKSSTPSSYYPGSVGCAISEADAQIIADKYESLTGYNGGGYGGRDVERITGSLIARLDWNISDKHKFSLRYNFLDASKDTYSNTLNSYLFNGTGYKGVSRTHSLIGELNSRISQTLFNSLRVGYTRVFDTRESDARLPYVTISKLRDGDRTSVSIGTDPYCAMNALTQNVITISDHLSIYKGNHTITVGTDNEIFLADNLYIANSLGSYTYNTLADFLSDTPSSFVCNTPIGDPATHVKSAQFGFYIQDKWSIGNFTLSYGLRADIPVLFNQPLENPTFNATDIAAKYNIATNNKPRTNILWSPRIGFRWRAYSSANYTATLYGGVGLFSGRVPFVWVSNCYSNTGMTQNGYMLYGSDIPAFGNIPTGNSTVSNPNINVVDTSFKYPQVLRATIGLEQRIGHGWHIAIEGSFSKTFNNIYFDNYVAQDYGNKLYAVSAAAANDKNVTPYYNSSLKSQYASIYHLYNTNKGYTYSMFISASKAFDFGLSASATYTFGHCSVSMTAHHRRLQVIGANAMQSTLTTAN
ncbi:MAG: TonB-dependent receptor [Alistipes sp.]|nr:TonB-dependent receptor [Alistipes sp.]